MLVKKFSRVVEFVQNGISNEFQTKDLFGVVDFFKIAISLK